MKNRFPLIAFALMSLLNYNCKSGIVKTDGNQPALKPITPLATAIQQEVKRFFDSSHLASVTVRVSNDSEQTYSGSFGMADEEQHVPANPQTVYAIGSISKSFTAYCILKLAEDGKLNLQSAVGKILPEIKGPPAKVTIAQLLVHTGGIPDYEPTVAQDEARTYRKDEILAVFNGKPLEFAPGNSFAYSNSDHYLLGLVIEKVTGETYAKVLDRMIIKPFGLTHTFYGARAPIVEWRARGYEWDDSLHLINAAPWHESVPFAAGGVISTSQDVDYFTRALVARAGMGPLIHAFEHAKLSNNTQLSYLPISLAEGRLRGKPYFWHAGEIDGFLAFSATLPSEHMTFTMLLNTIDPKVSPYTLFHRVARIALGIPLSDSLVKLNEQEASLFSGHYALYVLSALDGGHLMNKSFPAEFTFEHGAFVRKAGVGSDADQVLNYTGNGRFVSPADPDQAYIFKSINGKTHVMIEDITPWGGDREK